MKRAVLLPLVLTAACAGAPSSPPGGAAPLPPAARPADAEPASAAQPAEARPLAAPRELSSVLRIADVRRTWGNVAQILAGTPLGMMLLGPGQMAPEMLLEEALGPALAEVVDLGKPIDVAVLGTERPRFVASLSVPEREMRRLQERFVLKELKGLKGHRGMLRVEGAREAEPEDRALPGVCALEPGERSGSARLVCAEDVQDLVAAAPYLVQVVGREPLEADARIEVPGHVIVEGLESVPDEDDDSHAGKVGLELVDTFVRDVEGVSVDLTWVRPDIEVGFGMRFASRRSPLALAVAPAAARDAATPPAFFRLPRDTAIAFYTQGASRAELTPLREAFFRGIRDDMVDEGYDASGLDPFMERLGTLAFAGGPFVIGSGGDRAAAEKALAAYQGGKGAPRALKAARGALQSWFLVAVEEPAQAWISGVKELIQLGEKLDKKKASEPAAGSAAPAAGSAAPAAGSAAPAANDAARGAGATGGAPKGQAREGDEEDRERTDPVIVRAPAALPAGTLHVELRSRPLTKDAPPAHTSHLYVVPAGQRTWIGFGEDDAAVVARLRVAVDPGRDERTLGAAPGVEALRQPGTLAGGLFSLAGWTMLAASGDTPEALDDAAKALAGIAKLPSRGEIAMPFAMTSEVLGSGAARLSARVRVPSAGIHDVLALLMR
ncbi:hypothetical protein [Sorangium sp. So ce1099]|uniref:hypothetical protein n=1 Tax=Sorangium sp. So ce1099 TaxID=3133331 RepID=UPI003F5E453C